MSLSCHKDPQVEMSSELLDVRFADQGNWDHKQREGGQCLIRRKDHL